MSRFKDPIPAQLPGLAGKPLEEPTGDSAGLLGLVPASHPALRTLACDTDTMPSGIARKPQVYPQTLKIAKLSEIAYHKLAVHFTQSGNIHEHDSEPLAAFEVGRHDANAARIVRGEEAAQPTSRASGFQNVVFVRFREKNSFMFKTVIRLIKTTLRKNEKEN